MRGGGADTGDRGPRRGTRPPRRVPSGTDPAASAVGPCVRLTLPRSGARKPGALDGEEDGVVVRVSVTGRDASAGSLMAPFLRAAAMMSSGSLMPDAQFVGRPLHRPDPETGDHVKEDCSVTPYGS